MTFVLKNFGQDTIYVNIFLQIEWLIIGTPCRVMLYMLIQLILLRVVSITSGRVKMYYMIIMLKFMEPEAEVKLVQNFYYKIYLVCI